MSDVSRDQNPNPSPNSIDSNSKPITKEKSKRRLILMLVIPSVLLVIGAAFYLLNGGSVSTDNAYVKSDLVPISAEVSGITVASLAQQNQHVVTGQLLFKLDPQAYQVQLDQARAELAKVKTDLSALKASYNEKAAELELAKTRFNFAKKEEHRQQELKDKHFSTDANFDLAKQNRALAEQEIAVVKLDLERIAQALGGQPDAELSQHPDYLKALAQVQQARLNLDRTEVKAPQDGFITQPPRVGQYVQAGSNTMTLVAQQQTRIEANFMETDLTFVEPGQSVEIKIDTYPQHTWHGLVESLSPATGAEFSLIPAQNATGNWVKIAQRIPVRIKLIDSENHPALRSGFSAEVTIKTGHKHQILGFSI